MHALVHLNRPRSTRNMALVDTVYLSLTTVTPRRW
jgi:hypothetical protein